MYEQIGLIGLKYETIALSYNHDAAKWIFWEKYSCAAPPWKSRHSLNEIQLKENSLCFGPVAVITS